MSEIRQKRLRLKKKSKKGTNLFYGDSFVYIFVHSLFSIMIFFPLTLSIGLFSNSIESMEFWESIKFYIDIAFISFISGVLGRALGIFFMHLVIEGSMKVTLRSGKEYTLTKGIPILIIGIIGLVSIIGNLDISYYIFGLLVLLFLAINKFDNKSLVFLICSLMSSLCWIVGMLAILQTLIFDEQTIWTAICTYFSIKVGVYVIAKIIVDTKT